MFQTHRICPLLLHLPLYLGPLALAFGAGLLGGLLALGDHPVVDLLADLLDVVDPLDPHVHQLDAIARDELGRPR